MFTLKKGNFPLPRRLKEYKGYEGNDELNPGKYGSTFDTKVFMFLFASISNCLIAWKGISSINNSSFCSYMMLLIGLNVIVKVISSLALNTPSSGSIVKKDSSPTILNSSW